MECPYCKNEMKSGKIYAACNQKPFWLEDGKKRSMGEMFAGEGNLPAQNLWTQIAIESFYCPKCKKLIIDADLKL